jgi:hypothetical protein
VGYEKTEQRTRGDAWLTCNWGEPGCGRRGVRGGSVIRQRDKPGLDGGKVYSNDLCSGEFVGDVNCPAKMSEERRQRKEGGTDQEPQPVPRSRTRERKENKIKQRQRARTNLCVVDRTGEPLLRGRCSFCLRIQIGPNDGGCWNAGFRIGITNRQMFM